MYYRLLVVLVVLLVVDSNRLGPISLCRSANAQQSGQDQRPGGARRPNVILVMADDLGYETIGANGGTSYRTPHLDRLAAGGLRFDHCYVQPLCTPTRVQLMTGAYNVRNYVTFGQMDPGLTTFGNLFRSAGYVTGITGKWQLGKDPDLPRKFGFDEHCLWQHTRRPPRYANPGLEINGVERDFTQGEYGPDLVNAFACDFVRRHQDQPFFLYYPMMLTHGPYQPTPDSKAWDPQAVGENVNQRAEHFGDMVEYMDKLMGRLVTSLDEYGIRRNTLLLFIGDNGTGKGTKSRMGEQTIVGGKGSTTAAGMHVPCIVSWPEVMAAGRVSSDLVDSTDFLPTICEAAGIAIPAGMTIDGRSFAPQLRGQPGQPRDWVYSWYSPRGEPLRECAFDRQFKLYADGTFFDLIADRQEEHPRQVGELTGDLAEAAGRLRGVLNQFAKVRPDHLPRPAAAKQSDDAPSPAANPLNKKNKQQKKTGTKKVQSSSDSDAYAFDAKNVPLENPPSVTSEDFLRFGIYEKTAPRPAATEPVATQLPLQLNRGDRIALIGNTLLDRSRLFGHLEALLHQRFPQHRLVVRYLAWSADAIDQQPRPANFADTEQHLMHEQSDVIFAAFGFNESFAGDAGLEDFRRKLTEFVSGMKRKAFDGESGPRIVLISPIANENLPHVPAADLNNDRLEKYVQVLREVASREQVGFADVFSQTREAMRSPGSDWTLNGIHLTKDGDRQFSQLLYEQVFQDRAPEVLEAVRAECVSKNDEYFRRFRPLNTFYYTGGRNKDYGYLDFLPAMRNFDLMVANRDQRIWDLAQGQRVPARPDDSNVPPLPATIQSRGANEWLTADQELAAFQVDPRFEVNLFAGEEQFPEIAAPIQMRWDARGRLWVSCSTTYPHVYPGNRPNDKLVILEDVDGDGRADKSRVFADDLHIPLSFEFGDGGVYVSEMPHLTFLRDTDGDDRADVRQELLTGFGTEDSHHALHDFTWTPDGDLIFRESVFHHSQVETPYGPVRQQNSGWFRFTPRTHRLISFGTYNSTNPWGVTFDDWGQHVASHPLYAAAFHALDPPYPQQHPPPKGLRAYSGVCGHEFVDFATFPPELQGGFIKVRYKPTNRVEIHKWIEGPFGYDEEYVGDLLFSTNLSFIPVDLQFGPRGDLFVCDWYNPVKGHMQYSLRDERRDRHSGRIWRITAKGLPLQDPPRIAEASIAELLEQLKRPEYRVRYWAKRELRERSPAQVKSELDAWVRSLDPADSRYRHHQLEAVWAYRWIHQANTELLRELLSCDNHHARAAATQQLRYWHPLLPDAASLLNKSANDPQGIVRMEAAIAASYIGTKPAFDAMIDVLNHPRDGHLAYAITCSLGSHTLRPYWESDPQSRIARLLRQVAREQVIKEPAPNASEAQFDSQPNLKAVSISCVPERMLFTVSSFVVAPGQPLKVVFTNPDATDHNLVFVRPGALAEVGMAANEMAKDPRNANSDFVPPQKRDLILQASTMIGPTRPTLVQVLRFVAPEEPGVYPFVCTFPGHWVVMNGVMVVAQDAASADALLAANQPKIVREWAMSDFANFSQLARPKDEPTLTRGMTAFVKARCNQCHVVAGHGVNLGPDLTESVKKLTGEALLREILEPSHKIHEKFQNVQFISTDGRSVTGVVMKEERGQYQIATNLLTPETLTTLRKREIEERIPVMVSPMPAGLVNVLTRDEILDLHAFVEAGGYRLPQHLQHRHSEHH